MYVRLEEVKKVIHNVETGAMKTLPDREYKVFLRCCDLLSESIASLPQIEEN